MPIPSEERPAPAPGARAHVPSLSAVVPMHDEAENAGRFLPALRDALAALTDRFEIVVVNDGSRDATRQAVLAAAPACRVRYLELSRNFGKEAAISAGLVAARGEVVVLLDGDFQHPLSDLPGMLARWREGYDMVYGVRSGRDDERWSKRLGAAMFYGILSRGSSVEIPPGAGDFRLMDRKVVDALVRLPERSRFMKGLYGWVGFRSTAFTYDVQPRAAGRSSFVLHRLVGLAVAGITAFSYLPLRLIGAVGVVISLVALGYGGWVLAETLVLGADVPGYPTIVVSIMFFSGVQLLSLGVLGEYLARVYEEVKRRPNYLVAEDQDFSALPPPGRASR
jgi:glycosyltransferase involved in cell wall biosynthesis